jgi:uncharacterized membrane protein
MSAARRARPKAFFDDDEQKAIVEAIVAAEQATSGEIRVHLEHHCEAVDAYERARQLFEKLGMTATEQRNGVLLYLATGDGVFALIGDRGIDEVVGAGFWDDVVVMLETRFRAGEFSSGITDAIARVGEKLSEFFPYAGDDADINELDDDISYS